VDLPGCEALVELLPIQQPEIIEESSGTSLMMLVQSKSVITAQYVGFPISS
jgi:hypothetical protein